MIPAPEELVRRIPAIAAVLAVTACGDPVIPEGGPRGLEVVGDVTIDGSPAYGVVRLLNPSDGVLAFTELIYGRYALSSPVTEGSDVCSGYSVRIDTVEDIGPRTVRMVLESTTGPCLMSLPGISHHIDLDLPRQQLSPE